MKLAKVEHDRCGEWAATTYLMVPDELSEDEFDAAVDRAEEKYLAVLTAWNKTRPVPWTGVGLSINPSQPLPYPLETTLGDMLADLAAKREAYAEWEKRKSEAVQSFGVFLHREIPGSQWTWQADTLKATINWGHRHGESIDYGEEADSDLPGPSRLNLTAEELTELETL